MYGAEDSVTQTIGSVLMENEKKILFRERSDIKMMKEQEMKEQETNQVKSSVKQEDVCDIMNIINDALEGTGYQATAYDNTGIWLNVIIEG